jgi:hypothetical protein
MSDDEDGNYYREDSDDDENDDSDDELDENVVEETIAEREEKDLNVLGSRLQRPPDQKLCWSLPSGSSVIYTQRCPLTIPIAFILQNHKATRS